MIGEERDVMKKWKKKNSEVIVLVFILEGLKYFYGLLWRRN